MRRLTILLSLLLMMASCVSGVKGRPLDELVGDDKGQKAYVVNAGDTLNVQVWGEAKLSGDLLVREDGRLTLALIGEVEAAGKTLQEVSDEISKKLESFISGPAVSVSVAQVAPVKYYLSGAFQKPGEYRSDGQINFLQAVSTGGGFAPFADESSIVLIRKTNQGELRYEFDYNRVVQGREPNPLLRNGDLISVR